MGARGRERPKRECQGRCLRRVRADGEQAEHDQGRVAQAERRVGEKLMKKMLVFIYPRFLLSLLGMWLDCFLCLAGTSLGPGQWHWVRMSHGFPVWPLRGPSISSLRHQQWSLGSPAVGMAVALSPLQPLKETPTPPQLPCVGLRCK